MKKYLEALRKLYVLFALVLLIPVCSVGILSYISAKDSIKEEILFSANESVEMLNKLIDKTISEKIQEVGVFSEAINASMYEEGEASVRKMFKQYIALNPGTLSIYVGTQDGKFIVEPKSMNLQIIPWKESGIKAL